MGLGLAEFWPSAVDLRAWRTGARRRAAPRRCGADGRGRSRPAQRLAAYRRVADRPSSARGSFCKRSCCARIKCGGRMRILEGELYFNLHTTGQTNFGDMRGQSHPAQSP